jgi:hypothetical protein
MSTCTPDFPAGDAGGLGFFLPEHGISLPDHEGAYDIQKSVAIRSEAVNHLSQA